MDILVHVMCHQKVHRHWVGFLVFFVLVNARTKIIAEGI